ncbi:putative bacteriophage tail protein gpT [Acinetobacter sp. 1130196]|uniref:phage tail tape measure protein n=1 Tax=Acinetobacter calcoaceticus/baumannii complex TaxID=909768 RepID=UPI00044E7A61|nr:MULTISPECIES: phage tail length tape measure protein [Acinetobacter calcoaceticus/baumannii complex]EKU6035124.1 phage tail tape measure protein [Acinetobacter nosocomialis]EXR18201.1 putative bacteriophage tail protein gpT [Acinetobacter sp. 1130196]OTL04401.1 phage tail tape measure protein [Acinetobacter nosocomialis]OTU50228.1 phage tail tape measure protein [Acinetobacter nosocomialis]
MKPLKLEVLFGSKDSLSPVLKLMIGNSKAASNALKRTSDEVKKLNDQQKQIDGYVKQKKATEESAKALKDMQDRIKTLRQQMNSNPSAELTRDFEKAKAAAKRLKDSHQQNTQQLHQLRTEMNQSGLSTSNLSQHQSELRRRTDQATSELERQRRTLRNLNNVQQQHQRYSQNARTAGMTGMMMAGAGVGTLYAMRKPIDESKRVDIEENRIASLGFGKQATEEAIQYARAMKTFGTSTLDNLTLVRDGVTAFGDVHHAQWVAPTLAKMKFANEAMYGDHGVENEKKFMDMLKVIEMRNGLKSKESFTEQANIIQQVITATGGRVQAEEWLNVIKTGGIAAKGMDNKAFYYKMEPLVQEMGGFRVGTSMMSAYQNLYQGRTTQRAAANLDKFGLIGDYSKVKHNKTGDLSYLDIGAIKNAALFKKDQFAWMEQVLVPALNAKGITKESDVIDAIGSIFSNRTASNLFAQMYMQRDQIHKNAKLNEGAFNIDQLEKQAQGTTAGKELDAKAKLHDAYLQFGQTILPIYTQALIMASNAMQGFTGWMQQNPTLAKALGTGLLVIAAGLVAIGGLLLVFSPLILSMLSLRLMMVTLGVQGSALSFVFKMLTSPFKALGSAIMWIGRMFLLVGRMMMANPILLAITLLATAAYLIYKNWDPIKTFFSDLWNKVVSAFQTGINWIKGIIQSVDTVFANNPILNFLLPFIGIPRMIIANWSSITAFFSEVWTSITSGASELWNSISLLFSPIGQWFAEKWDEIKRSAATAWNSVIGYVYNAWETLKNVISNNPLLQRIMDGWNTIFTYLGTLKDKMLSIGSNIINGLIDGIKSGFTQLKSVWGMVNNYMPDFMRKRMDIHSPSRVMAGLGGHIIGGIGMGLTQAFPELKNKYNQVLNLFTNKSQSPVLDQIDIAAPVMSKIQAAPNLTPSRQSSLAVAGDTYTIHIHAAPGQIVQDLERQIEQVVMRIQRDKLARVRTIMSDQE